MEKREYWVAKASEWPDEHKEEVKAGDTTVLLIRHEGVFYALYPKCTHYGAPLVKGALNGNRLVCPWHHACFDVHSGINLEAPGLDGLPTYKVVVRDDDVHVYIPEGELPDRKPNPLTLRDPNSKDVYAIVGGGVAAQYAAEGMREAGYRGRIIMITAESEAPYDRTNVSKMYLQGEAPEEQMYLRKADFYEKYGIELLKNHCVKSLDPFARRIDFDNGGQLTYDKALLCTGGEACNLRLEGIDKPNVFLLRSLSDSRQLRDAATEGTRVVIVGGSFIGLEGAMSLRKRGCDVTVVTPDITPFQKIWGQEVGKRIQQWHEEAGVKFRLERKVMKLHGDDKVNEVVLDNGDTLPADLVLVGIGVKPALDFLRGVEREKDGGVKVDSFLRITNTLYAAGDIAYVPFGPGHCRIEHWKVAGQQGRIAGKNMAGAGQLYDTVPFFWTNQQGRSLRYVGYVEDYDDVLISGSLQEDKFLAYYIKYNQIKAVLGLGHDADIAAIQELMYNGSMPGPEALEEVESWENYLKQSAVLVPR
ncbi:FAD-dependent oxidoreductase [Telluribacter sp. SYSU D00476]|uniref:FAD-dependent oxidoreductase n=1 Tax=Telluribacter sp. SYSU D00476 TaxID=2811430 RepID=UPI001FF20BAA|nr:FAD-dependent oxidoreductase [Telluribacter sp. SYSU D00476]